jgi:hypothetical protein
VITRGRCLRGEQTGSKKPWPPPLGLHACRTWRTRYLEPASCSTSAPPLYSVLCRPWCPLGTVASVMGPDALRVTRLPAVPTFLALAGTQSEAVTVRDEARKVRGCTVPMARNAAVAMARAC